MSTNKLAAVSRAPDLAYMFKRAVFTMISVLSRPLSQKSLCIFSPLCLATKLPHAVITEHRSSDLGGNYACPIVGLLPCRVHTRYTC